MLLLVSPAKDLDFEPLTLQLPLTQPDMLAQSQQLADICKTLKPADLSSLMHISDKLAGLNAARFAQWQLPFTEQNAKAKGGEFQLNRSNSKHIDAQGVASADAALRYRMPAEPSLDQNTVDLQIEQSNYAENSVQFQASFTLLNSKFKGLTAALRGE